MAPLRVLELYSGVGGLHCGLTESGASAEVVAAVDVNTIANEVYKHNFPGTPLWPKSIEGISVKELDALSVDMILMSPPCQPFTRIGLRGDVSDPRAKSFLYVLEILPRLQKTPGYILLENVKGFESSEARDATIRTLESCGYIYQEFLLSPPCLGIPNSRLRYFLIAKLQAEQFAFQTTNNILEEFPSTDTSDHGCSSRGPCLEGNLQPDADPKSFLSSGQSAEGAFLYKLETAEQLQRKMNQDNDASVQMLRGFLEENVEIRQHLLPPKSLLRYALILDIVKPTCRRSTCFTKGYGHYMEGTGSILQAATDVEPWWRFYTIMTKAASSVICEERAARARLLRYASLPPDNGSLINCISSVYNSLETLSDEEKLAKLSTLKLRYFTPREIANLHGFPAAFGFPDEVTTKQRYRLLGNSLNVHVVAKLIALMLRSPRTNSM